MTTEEQRGFIESALEHLEEACIGTIHSFCAQILRERPVEAVVDPAFEELSEQQASRIYERAFRAWFQEKLARARRDCGARCCGWPGASRGKTARPSSNCSTPAGS